MENWIQYLIILIILIIIGIAITRSKKKDFKMEVNKLVNYLGGKDILSIMNFTNLVLLST